jgi:hypothetical protein
VRSSRWSSADYIVHTVEKKNPKKFPLKKINNHDFEIRILTKRTKSLLKMKKEFFYSAQPLM